MLYLPFGLPLYTIKVKFLGWYIVWNILYRNHVLQIGLFWLKTKIYIMIINSFPINAPMLPNVSNKTIFGLPQ